MSPFGGDPGGRRNCIAMIALSSFHPSPTRTCAVAVGVTAVAVAVDPFVAVALGLAAVAAAVDARCGMLPDRLVLGVAAPAVLVALVAAIGGDRTTLAVVVAGAAVLAAPLFVLHLVSPTSLGFGDVKLGAALGAVLGLGDPRLGMAALFVAAGASLLWAVVARRASIPLGPGLVGGAALVAVVASELGTVWA